MPKKSVPLTKATIAALKKAERLEFKVHDAWFNHQHYYAEHHFLYFKADKTASEKRKMTTAKKWMDRAKKKRLAAEAELRMFIRDLCERVGGK